MVEIRREIICNEEIRVSLLLMIMMLLKWLIVKVARLELRLLRNDVENGEIRGKVNATDDVNQMESEKYWVWEWESKWQ